MSNNREIPLTSREIRKSVRRFAMAALAPLGHMPAYLPPRAVKKTREKLAAGKRDPLFVDIPYRTTFRMGRAISRVIVDILTFGKRSDRRRLTYLSAACGVAVSQYFELSGTRVDGTVEAILSAVRYVNEDLLGVLPPSDERIAKYLPDAIAALKHEDPLRGAHRLAAALRGMYRLRTIKEQVSPKWQTVGDWLLAVVVGALAVTGCVLAIR